MRVLVCPDKFRGTLGAAEAAEAFAVGWRRSRPGDDLDLAPMADGGEGTAEALAGGGARWVAASVHGPLGDLVDAGFAVLPDGAVVIESARAVGLGLLAVSRRNPRRTTTIGVGELIRRALDEGSGRIVVCLGGSATNDGGAGMAVALGARLLDGRGAPIPAGAEALLDLASVDITDLDPRLVRAEVVGLADVRNPLTGPIGASAVFAPQKGATEDDVWLLERALRHLAAVVGRDLGTSPAAEPGAGAAGGLGFGLVAFAGARLRPGAAAVADAIDLEGRLRDADLVVTGEGAFDATSLRGKVVGHVVDLARLARVPVLVVCGRADTGVTDGSANGLEVRTLVEEVGAEAATERPRDSLVAVAASLAAGYGGTP